MHQAVQPAEGLADRIAECGRVVVGEGIEIAGHDHRLGFSVFSDPVRNRFQLAAGPAEQDHVGAESGESPGSRSADAITGTGDQNDLAGQTVCCRLVAPVIARSIEFRVAPHQTGFRACIR